MKNQKFRDDLANRRSVSDVRAASHSGTYWRGWGRDEDGYRLQYPRRERPRYNKKVDIKEFPIINVAFDCKVCNSKTNRRALALGARYRATSRLGLS